MKYENSIIRYLIIFACIISASCTPGSNNTKNTLLLEKFSISEKSINEFFSVGLYKGFLDEGNPILVLATLSNVAPKPNINMGSFYKLIDGKKIELGVSIMNPPFVFGFIGMYENGKLKLDTTIELGSKDLKIDADTVYNVPTEIKDGFTLVRYFEISKINDNTYNKPYLAFIYKKKVDKH